MRGSGWLNRNKLLAFAAGFVVLIDPRVRA
jgi:hypothetical protein